MAFPEPVKDAAFQRSGGQCECRRSATHSHNQRCTARITRYGAEYHHVTAQSVGGHDGLSNCEVLCVPCHKGTDSYGRS